MKRYHINIDYFIIIFICTCAFDLVALLDSETIKENTITGANIGFGSNTKGEFPIEPWYALVKIAPSVYKSVQVY